VQIRSAVWDRALQLRGVSWLRDFTVMVVGLSRALIAAYLILI